MVNFNIKVEGDKKLVKKFESLEGDLKDFKKEMDELGQYFAKFFSVEVFATEGDVFGEQWPRLSPNYEFYKRKKYAGRGILNRTGDLMKGYRYTANKTEVTIKNIVDYAIYHQSDEPRKSNLPRRVLVKIDDERKEYILDVFKQGVAQRLQKLSS